MLMWPLESSTDRKLQSNQSLIYSTITVPSSLTGHFFYFGRTRLRRKILLVVNTWTSSDRRSYSGIVSGRLYDKLMCWTSFGSVHEVTEITLVEFL
jgi:hypothetical protein